jgi:hypothetical protein
LIDPNCSSVGGDMTVSVSAPFIGHVRGGTDPVDRKDKMAISVHSTMATTVGQNVQIKIGQT